MTKEMKHNGKHFLSSLDEGFFYLLLQPSSYPFLLLGIFFYGEKSAIESFPSDGYWHSYGRCGEVLLNITGISSCILRFLVCIVR
ncbi:CAAX prenyl protease 2 isoform X1 [Iris pallida]|uniref:CAAX prenyl protease 2 isoform X1 n=1 Tax=Iris pallida TaxID=29817 RepID=A0AAX6DGU3_IRIPA|nr:CAAX prenyl protease 2 isoform X1 [Iris pallida]